MADAVKVSMVIDCTGAIKNIEKLTKAVGDTTKTHSAWEKEIVQSNNKLLALNEQLAKGAKVRTKIKQVEAEQNKSIKGLLNSYKLEYESLKAQGVTIKELEQYYKALEKTKRNLYKKGATGAGDQLDAQMEEVVSVMNKMRTEQSKLDAQEQQATVTNNAYNTSLAETQVEMSGIQKYGKKLISILGNIMGFQLIIATVRKALTLVTQTIKDSIEASAELEQNLSKLSTVFEGFSNSATQTAETLASKIGVATSTAASSLSTIGDLLQAQGMGTSESLETATRWAEQFQDIIAFKDINMDLEEFAENFMSGAAGNLRNFRTFGSIVKESAVNAELAKKGLDKLTGSELELAKMTTRAEMALEQQQNAIGATEREWNTTLSINRRLSEAQKEWKENLGDTLNDGLKPLKIWWTKVLEETNKANKAMKQYAEGLKDINVYDIENDESDYKRFKKEIKKSNLVDSVGYGNLRTFNKNDTANQDAVLSVLQYINSVIVTYGAEAEDAIEIIGKNLSDDAKEWLRQQETLRNEEIKKQKALEQAYAALSSVIDRFDSVSESMLAINGVQYKSSPINFGSGDIGTAVNNQLLQDAEKAATSIMEATATSMGKALEASVDEFGANDLLEMQQESMRSLYEVLWNNFHSQDSLGGTSLTDEENKELKNIIDNYKSLNEQLEKNKKIEEAKTSLVTVGGNLISTQKKNSAVAGMVSRGMDEGEAEIRYSWIQDIEEITSLFKELGANTVEINGQLYTERQLLDLVAEQREQEIVDLKDKNKQEEEPTEWQELGKTYKDTLAPFLETFGAWWEKGFTEGDAGKEDANFLDKLIGGSFTGITAMFGGIADLAISMATQTEAFQEISTLLSDAIVPVLNVFLKPLLPVIKTITTMIQALVITFMKPLFPIIQGIAIVINTISGAVGAIWAWMSADLGKKNDAAAKAWDEALDRNAEIKAMKFTLEEIEDNTEDMADEFAYYQKLLNKGVINNSEYEALLSGFQYAGASSQSIGSYATGTNGVTYTTGDTNIIINADNYTSDEIVAMVQRAMAKNQQAGAIA